MLVTNSSVWQAHLERISDFLLAGKDVWWKESDNGDIEFNYGKGRPEFHTEGPVLHHFRSCSFKTEETYLKDCWKMCLQDKALIPAFKLCTQDDSGNLVLENLVCESETNEGSIGGGSVGSGAGGSIGEGSRDGGSVGGSVCGHSRAGCSVGEGSEAGDSVGGGSVVRDSFCGGSVAGGSIGKGSRDGGSFCGRSRVGCSVGEGSGAGDSVGGGSVVRGSVGGNSVGGDSVAENKGQDDETDFVDQNVISFKESTNTDGSEFQPIMNDAAENSTSQQSASRTLDEPTTDADSVSFSSTQCKTKFGRSFEKIIGQTEEVYRFDNARRRLKNSPWNKDYREQYLDNVGLMQTRVSRELSKTNEQLKTWEQQHFTKY